MKCAYVTLLSSNDYLYGVLGLKYSLEKVKSQLPLIVIVTKDVSEENKKILKENDVVYKEVPTIYFNIHPEEKYGDRYVTCANKMYLYTLTEYDKVIFVDADCVFIQNIDFFFNYPDPLFYVSNIFTKRYPNGDLWGGLFMVKPDRFIFEYFLKVYRYYYTDEEFLNEYYYWNENLQIFKYHYFVLHGFKYWKECELDSIEKVKNFLDYSQYEIMQNIDYFKEFFPHEWGKYEQKRI